MQKLMQAQVQKVDGIENEKFCETTIGAKLDAKHGAKDDTKLGIKPGVKSGGKPITIPSVKLGVRLDAKLGANFASSFAPYLINGYKQHQKWAVDTRKEEKRDSNHELLLQCFIKALLQITWIFLSHQKIDTLHNDLYQEMQIEK